MQEQELHNREDLFFMKFIKIPVESYTISQIDSIKKYANDKLGVNLNDEEITIAAIELLHSIYFIHSNMVLEQRKDKHLSCMYEKITNELIFLKFLLNAPKNIEDIHRVISNLELNNAGVEI